MGILQALSNFFTPQFIIGAIFCVVGSAAHHLGLSLFKFAIMRIREQNIEHQRHYLLDRRGQIAVAVIILGLLSIGVSLLMLEMSFVAQIMFCTLYLSVHRSAKYSADKFTGTDRFSLVLCVLSVLCQTVVSNKIISRPTESLVTVTELTAAPTFRSAMFYLFCFGVFGISLAVFSVAAYRKSYRLAHVVAIGSSALLAVLYTLKRMVWEIFVSMVSAPESDLRLGVFLVGIIIILAPLSMAYVHSVSEALRSFEQPIIVIVMQIVLSLMVTFSGLVVYGEVGGMGWLDQLIIFLFLIAVNMACVSMLLTSHASMQSIYPLYDTHRDGMIRLANVDLDLDFEDSDDEISMSGIGSNEVSSKLVLDNSEPGLVVHEDEFGGELEDGESEHADQDQDIEFGFGKDDDNFFKTLDSPL